VWPTFMMGNIRFLSKLLPSWESASPAIEEHRCQYKELLSYALQILIPAVPLTRGTDRLDLILMSSFHRRFSPSLFPLSVCLSFLCRLIFTYCIHMWKQNWGGKYSSGCKMQIVANVLQFFIPSTNKTPRTMRYNISNRWVSGLCPSFGILDAREQNVSETGWLLVYRLWRETPTLLGPLERTSLNRWTADCIFLRRPTQELSPFFI
jgi:hypothetical protein